MACPDAITKEVQATDGATLTRFCRGANTLSARLWLTATAVPASADGMAEEYAQEYGIPHPLTNMPNEVLFQMKENLGG